jgi:hypothetical protein
MLPGDQIVCATPYINSNGDGADGVSKCVKFSVITQTLPQYYPKPGQNLNLTASWGTETNGNGNSPGSFTNNFQVFNVNKAATQGGVLIIGGNESALWVREGGEMTVNNSFIGVINVEGNGIVNVTTSQPVAFGTISSTSTIRFGTSVTSIPTYAYGNVEILGSGTKTLGTGTTIINGNLSIANNAIINGAANNTSVIQLSGNLTLEEDTDFNPAIKFGLTLSGGQPHAITLLGTKAVFNQLTVLGGSVVTVAEGTVAKTFEFGSNTGGGLTVETGSELNLGKNNLNITGAGTINSQNQTGRVAFNRSTLTVTSTSAFNSNLYTLPTRDTVAALVTTLTGGALYLHDSVFLTNRVKIFNGTVHSNNFLTLVSTATQTARIEHVEGNGNITGAVQFQRVIQKGRKYRYLSFPVAGIKVSDLQSNQVPVTGDFSGASTGPGLFADPSLFYYQEPAGWIPFPSASTSTTSSSEFIVGRGYSAFVRDGVNTTKLALTGNVHIGDFPFTIQPGTTDPMVGWNLIGNPYAAPVQWGGTWSANGINQNAYVRDNDYAEGRFLVWNGALGDAEFGGLIAQGQAFWVKANTGTASLIVHESNKAATQATFFRTQDDSDKPVSLSIALKQAELIDRAYLAFNNRSGSRFDPYYDGLKQKNGYFNLSVLSSDSVSIAIKNLPDSACSLQIGISMEDVKPASYSLSFQGSFFDNKGTDLFLQDRYLDSLVKINQQTRYVFAVTDNLNSFGRKRFRLRIEKQLPEPLISVEGNQLMSNLETGNQWLLNGEEISGATDPMYIPEASGEYQLQISQAGCTRTSVPISYVITGIEKNQPVSIFPNPAGHSITITGLNTVTKYSILNPVGQLIQQGRLLNTSSDNKIALSTAPGIYLIILENESLLYRGKLIVQ